MSYTDLINPSGLDQFEKLAGEVLHRNDDERRRMARNLHDTTAQNLAALSIKLALMARERDLHRIQAIAAECSILTDECLQELRLLSSSLHPPLLDELGLESALLAFVDAYHERTGIPVELITHGNIGRLPPELELVAFRTIQESLFDLEQHSSNAKAQVALELTSSELHLVVRDWGGDAGQSGSAGKGLELGGMRERVLLLGGTLEVFDANPGRAIRAIFRMDR